MGIEQLINSENATDLSGLVEVGKVTPVIDRTYPVSEAPAAIHYLVDGRACGKIVVAG
jgi:NADPH:quinone reductase-like Zn-dependent oxidoreductase